MGTWDASPPSIFSLAGISPCWHSDHPLHLLASFMGHCPQQDEVLLEIVSPRVGLDLEIQSYRRAGLVLMMIGDCLCFLLPTFNNLSSIRQSSRYHSLAAIHSFIQPHIEPHIYHCHCLSLHAEIHSLNSSIAIIPNIQLCGQTSCSFSLLFLRL